MTKGAVAAVGEACGLDAAGDRRAGGRADEQAAKGYRTLAVARGAEGGPLRLIGLVRSSDTPRPDAAELIAGLADLGVAVKMLTGDALPSPRRSPASVGLGDDPPVGDLSGTSGPRRAERSPRADGYAEVYPEDKYRRREEPAGGRPRRRA